MFWWHIFDCMHLHVHDEDLLWTHLAFVKVHDLKCELSMKDYELVGTTNTSLWSIFDCTCTFVCIIRTFSGLCWHLWRSMTWMWTFMKHHGNSSEDYNMFWWSIFDYTCTFVCTMMTYTRLYCTWRSITWHVNIYKTLGINE
jgi:hypothetical protein